MSDGTPNDPNQRPMPWDAKPDGGGADPSAPLDPTEVVQNPDASPPAPAEPAAPPLVPADPAAQPGLISAAPVGWAANQGSTTGPAAAGPAGTEPASNWAPPPAAREVPGAPGLAFADTVSRLVAFIIDVILISIVAGIIASILGFGTNSVTVGADGTYSYYSGVDGAAIGVPSAILGLLYFVFFWTGGRRATPGQRIFNLQVGNAFDGRGLTLDQAVRRWLGYGTFLGVLAIIPAIYGVASLAQLVWVIVLLVSTATSSTKQGLHDRFANTAVVRPSGQGSRGLAAACLIVVLVVLALLVLSFVALIFLGSQMSQILSEVGESI